MTKYIIKITDSYLRRRYPDFESKSLVMQDILLDAVISEVDEQMRTQKNVYVFGNEIQIIPVVEPPLRFKLIRSLGMAIKQS